MYADMIKRIDSNKTNTPVMNKPGGELFTSPRETESD